MSKRPKLVNTKKAGGSDFDHMRAVSYSGKVFLSLCLSAHLSISLNLVWCGLQHTYVPLCLNYDLFRIIILIYAAFCGSLYSLYYKVDCPCSCYVV